MKKKLLKRVMVFCGISCVCGILAVWCADLYVQRAAAPYLDQSLPAAVDAILIPGAAVRGDTVSYVLQARLDKGLELYRSGISQKIIVSGDHGSEDYDEVNAMRKYLMERGVPREAIFMDHAGFDSYSSMYRARDVFCAQSLMITSQAYHNERTVFIGRGLGLSVYGAAAEDVYIDPYRIIREPLARVKAVWQTALKPKPKFLGDTLPVWGDGTATDDGKS